MSRITCCCLKWIQRNLSFSPCHFVIIARTSQPRYGALQTRPSTESIHVIRKIEGGLHGKMHQGPCLWCCGTTFRLCESCDERLHHHNKLVSRHIRVPLNEVGNPEPVQNLSISSCISKASLGTTIARVLFFHAVLFVTFSDAKTKWTLQAAHRRNIRSILHDVPRTRLPIMSS